jgi:hypothetical protein
VKQNKLTRCLGFNIEHDSNNGTLTLSKNDYAENLVTEYNQYISKIPFQSVPIPDSITLSKAQSPKNDSERLQMEQLPYRQILGKLNYFTCTLRADIAFAVNLLARFMDNPGNDHWLALLNVLAYIRDHPYAYITYRNPTNRYYSMDAEYYRMEPNQLYCFVDADFASSDLEHRRSVTGYVIFFNDGIINWKSILQRRTSSSSTEAEFRALHEACKECIWLMNILTELGYTNVSPVLMFEDNTSTIAATKNPVAHSKLKHLDTIYHQVRDFIDLGQVKISHIDTNNQLADLLTKLHSSQRHHELNNHIISIYSKNTTNSSMYR